MLEWFLRGGPVMYPLLALSLLGLAIVVERLLVLREKNFLDPAQLAVLGELLAAGEFTRAREYCAGHTGPLPVLVTTLLDNRHAPYDELKELLEDTGRHQLRFLERGLGALATVVAAAPLLGLLGTVLGMIQVFEAVSLAGTVRGEQLSAGIAQALITTAAGLIIAIPMLFLHAYLEGKAQSLVQAIEARTLEFLHLVRRPKQES
ncbi:MAG: biopolymer transporter ExbB [Thermoanaerobaculum sp.]|mgnify:CR=1 FL=1|uniref:MotA/TolQ/ExbB proton channel family protein n=1 Tax=Thermoanaerobaculum aquaticum TaxID=1312852 RepID=A0A7C2N8P5_9BACT|nr:MAG: biopolymer transporter ExbB [Thermoanaerobaculum sp.]